MTRVALAAVLVVAACGFDDRYDVIDDPDGDGVDGDRSDEPMKPTEQPDRDEPTPPEPECDPAREVNLIRDGDFDRKMGVWIDTSPFEVISAQGPIAAFSPRYLAWLGGESFMDERLYQPVDVPAGVHKLVLRAQLAVDEPTISVDDTEIEVLITDPAGNTLEVVDKIESGDLDDRWTLRAWQLNRDYAGQTIEVMFHVNTDAAAIDVLIDDVELLARECDVTSK